MQELCYIMLYKLYIIFAYCISQIIVQSLARAELKSDGLEIQGKAGPGNSIKRSSLHSIYVPDLKQMLVILATPTNLMAVLLHCSSNAGPGGSVTKQPTCGQYFCSIYARSPIGRNDHSSFGGSVGARWCFNCLGNFRLRAWSSCRFWTSTWSPWVTCLNGHVMFMFSLPTVSNLIHLFLYTLLRSGRTTHTQSNRWFFPTDMQFKVEVHINSSIPCCSFHFGGKKFQKKAVWLQMVEGDYIWCCDIAPSNLWCRQEIWLNFSVSSTSASWCSDPCLNSWI